VRTIISVFVQEHRQSRDMETSTEVQYLVDSGSHSVSGAACECNSDRSSTVDDTTTDNQDPFAGTLRRLIYYSGESCGVCSELNVFNNSKMILRFN